MQYIERDTHQTQEPYFATQYAKESILFFDIETTGFSAATTTLYFIGCMFYRDNSWKIGTWFNDDGNAEEEMLTAFMQHLSAYQVLIHYNGDSFDIPYLTHKCEKYGISPAYTTQKSIDLYKLIRPYKQLLSLPNLKLKTIETFLGIQRNDTYQGGELIRVYHDYLHTGDQALLDILYQHNYEDILNLLACCEVARYDAAFRGNVQFASLRKSDTQITISCTCELPQAIRQTKQQTHLYADGKKLMLTIPTVTDTLNYYFPNPKDYYYLPIEDTAIHKSVAQYMDKSYRQKATRENCCQKYTDTYIPTYGYPAEKSFGGTYAERNRFLCASALDTADFNMQEYIQAILHYFIT